MRDRVRSHILLLILILGVLLIAGCNERRGGPVESIFEVHPSEWMQEPSTDFHANKVAILGIAYCADCHGSDYRGGRSAVSCYPCHGNGPSGHHADWMFPTAEYYHGRIVLQEGWESCSTCHGEDYRGGTSGKSCYECHDGPSGHLVSWMAASSENFHGIKVIEEGWQSCTVCHGPDYEGGMSGKSCYECHDGPSGHTEGWMTESSDDFHGEEVEDKGSESCSVCHGTDHTGGLSGISCYTCHNGPSGHPDEWMDEDSDYFHGKDIRDNGWDMRVCRNCHGDDYAGGSSGSSCLTCHSGTPEACNTCHGSNLNSSPPEDIEGNTETTFKGVGAHQAHVTAGSLTNQMSCSVCHIVPQSLYDVGHVDTDLPAEVHFGELASDNGRVSPGWDGVNNCNNVYCHGEFPAGNANNNPAWTSVGEGQSDCGTCHGLPPKQPHSSVTLCYLCHAAVVDQNQNIINKDKHINGKTDLQ